MLTNRLVYRTFNINGGVLRGLKERENIGGGVFFFTPMLEAGSSACTPLWEFWGCKNFSVQNPSEKSIPILPD